MPHSAYACANRVTRFVPQRFPLFRNDVEFKNPSSQLTVHCSQGFSLAEVLITLGIIGVVAALTIPILMNNYQEQQYKTAYKKAYSVASQALISANQNNAFESAPAGGSITDNNNFLAFMDQFKVIKKCISSNNSECWDSTGEKYGLNFSSGFPDNNSLAFIDSSGAAWSTLWYGSYILLDTNGFKKPNQYGKDRFFLFILNSNGEAEGLPAKIFPFADKTTDGTNNMCNNGNKCETENNYYGTSWLYN